MQWQWRKCANASLELVSSTGGRVVRLGTGEIPLKVKSQRDRMMSASTIFLATIMASSALSGCTTSEVIQNGYVVDEQTLALAPVGSSREQVLLSLGTPSVTATFDAEVFYYISQKRERMVAFMAPHLVQQNVLAVYFNKDGVVDHLANYKLKDGRVVDMISRTTPTGGTELTFLMRLLKGGINPAQAAQQILGASHTP
jgi:outer membrane protein assembly factor BamE (lipoprotein component of BamABCDE complex)